MRTPVTTSYTTRESVWQTYSYLVDRLWNYILTRAWDNILIKDPNWDIVRTTTYTIRPIITTNYS